MTLLYLDTSALARLYTREEGHEHVSAEYAQSSGVVCHDITFVEMASALGGRRRRKLMTQGMYEQAQRDFEADWPTFRHVAIDPPLLSDAARLAQSSGLRAYDAVHLAAALALVPLGVRFMTFDAALREVARDVLPAVWEA